KLALPFSLIILLLGCAQPAKQHAGNNAPDNTPSPVAYLSPAGDKIIFLDDYYTAYLNTIKAGWKNRDSLFRVKIVEPIHDKYFSKTQYLPNSNERPSFILRDTASLGAIIAGIEDHKVAIEKMIATTLLDCRGYIKNDSLTIYVCPATADTKETLKRMGGVNSWTVSKKQIVLVIDPQIKTWGDMLPVYLAHEYSHAFCWEKMNLSSVLAMNLLDRVISEGKANAFAHILYPDVKCPWDTALSAEGTAYQWSRIKMEMRSEEYYLNEGIMYGSDNYPAWTGYAVGTAIVQSALKNNPALTPEKWSNLSPGWILEISDYKTSGQ
ncbi:MAG TPA: DUF2268 domain-containing putative Zn-dependent protease, partial [Bacteroidia bacterium]|nr:DUF2268 domain-containing putative Zn-dependent protease [Bacteroidia bacterium]